MPLCPDPTNSPKYACEDELGNPIGSTPDTDSLGNPLFQAPLKRCGTGVPVCEDESVPGCPTDSSGDPLVYGPAPATDARGVPTGSSPIVPRVRVNRTGEPLFPYSVANKADQLVNLVMSDATPIPFDQATGTFTIPAVTLPGEVVVPELDVTCLGGMVELAADTYGVAPHYRSGTFQAYLTLGSPIERGVNCIPAYDNGPIVVNPSNEMVLCSGAINFVRYTDEDPVAFHANLDVPCESVVTVDGGGALGIIAPNTDSASSLSLQISFDAGATWKTIAAYAETFRVSDAWPGYRTDNTAQSWVLAAGVYTPQFRCLYSLSAGNNAHRVSYNDLAGFTWTMHRTHEA